MHWVSKRWCTDPCYLKHFLPVFFCIFRGSHFLVWNVWTDRCGERERRDWLTAGLIIHSHARSFIIGGRTGVGVYRLDATASAYTETRSVRLRETL